ncbi:protein draper-like [Gigantopelta aegis]|uniref:protein draper-like n=1 Tax=Gigantopelta aegis TaxID=1735272 RepID=UPI001B88AF07|nr:protein draper-like [Gigantopelta aegis]
MCPGNCNGCARSTGSCADGCVPGYFGETCDITCHGMCLDNSCDSPMGKCKEGCSWPDVYGPFCNYTCNGNCESVRCQRDASGDVLCSAECISGKIGDHCTQDCPDGMYMNITKPNFVLLILIPSVIIVILIGVIVHLILRRPISKKTSSEAHSLTTIHFSQL